MKFSKSTFGVITVIMCCVIMDTECFWPTTALELIREKFCVCPCGNPNGGKLYTVPSMQLNWFEAVAHCNSIGMSIASIKDANDRQLLQMFLQTYPYNTRSQAKKQYWIGANNLAADNGYRWGLSDQTVNTAEWNPASVPSNTRSKPLCVYIQVQTMQWTPAQCDDEPRHFICEY